MRASSSSREIARARISCSLRLLKERKRIVLSCSGPGSRFLVAQEVAVPEAIVAQNTLAGLIEHRLCEAGAAPDKRVELSLFAARVGVRRQVRQQDVVVRAPREVSSKRVRIDAAEDGSKSQGKE